MPITVDTPADPLISVVIPTCRRPDLLARCLDRLAPGVQTLPADRYEVVVTDDGLPTVASLVAERYPWARWFVGPRRGPAANRNSGARQARGGWLAFTDDDCVPDPDWLTALADAVGPGCEVYEGKTTCRAGIRSPLEHAPANEIGGYLWSCNMMVRTGLFWTLSGFDENFPYPHMEDVDFRERLRSGGYRFEFVAGAVVDHPPRRQSSGWRLARSQESWVYYWYKHGRTGRVGVPLLREIARHRINGIRRCPLGKGSFAAALSLGVELVGILVHLPGWERRYRPNGSGGQADVRTARRTPSAR